MTLGDLREESLRRAARARTGLADFGDPTFVEPLRLLLASLEREAELQPFGRLFARRVLVHTLANRLRLEDDWKRHPAILDERVHAPLFVLGPSRSGTTLLFKLLTGDPAHRWLSYWEAHTPSPPPVRETYAVDARRRAARREVRALDYLVPNLLAIHEFEAEGPEECFPLLANTLAGVQFSWMFDVPTYDRWLTDYDMTGAYRYYRQQLQLLQWRCPGERWVLKSPVHLFAINALLASFPDARIVQLHRDPLAVLPSTCSLTATMRGLASTAVHPQRIGTQVSEALAIGFERAMRSRRHADPARFCDVYYRDLMRDPIAVVRAIYRHFDIELTPAAECAMLVRLADTPRHERGVHRYSLEQFHLDREQERRRFAAYREAFEIPEDE